MRAASGGSSPVTVFSANSIWNQQIPAGVTLSGSAEWPDRTSSNCGFAHPVGLAPHHIAWSSSVSDDVYQIRYYSGSYGLISTYDRSGNTSGDETTIAALASDTFPIPAHVYSTALMDSTSKVQPLVRNAFANAGSPPWTFYCPASSVPPESNDAWWSVIQPDGDTVWEFLAATKLSSISPKQIVCTFAHSYKLSEAGYGYAVGPRASQLPIIAGVLTSQDLNSGTLGASDLIQHALCFIVDEAYQERDIRPPATTIDHSNSYAGNAPMGALFKLPDSVDLDTLTDQNSNTLTPLIKSIGYCLKNYGARLVDRGGGGGLSLCSEGGNAHASLPQSMPANDTAGLAKLFSLVQQVDESGARTWHINTSSGDDAKDGLTSGTAFQSPGMMVSLNLPTDDDVVIDSTTTTITAITGWSAASGSPTNTDTFETGSAAGFWDTGPTVVGGSLITGTYSAQIDGSSQAYLYPGANDTYVLKFKFRLSSSSTAGNSNQTRWDVVKTYPNYLVMWLSKNSSGNWYLGAGTAEATLAQNMQISTNTTYDIEFNLNGGAWSFIVDSTTRASGTTVLTDTSSADETILKNEGWNSTAFLSYIDDVEIYIDASGSSTVWEATVASEPEALQVGYTMGSKKGSLGALAAQGDWYWASNVLSLYSTSGDPDSGFSPRGIRALI